MRAGALTRFGVMSCHVAARRWLMTVLRAAVLGAWGDSRLWAKAPKARLLIQKFYSQRFRHFPALIAPAFPGPLARCVADRMPGTAPTRAEGGAGADLGGTGSHRPSPGPRSAQMPPRFQIFAFSLSKILQPTIVRLPWRYSHRPPRAPGPGVQRIGCPERPMPGPARPGAAARPGAGAGLAARSAGAAAEGVWAPVGGRRWSATGRVRPRGAGRAGGGGRGASWAAAKGRARGRGRGRRRGQERSRCVTAPRPRGPCASSCCEL